MFGIFGDALEVSLVERLFLNTPILSIISSILLIIFLVIGHFSKKSVRLQRPALIKSLVVVASGLDMMACLFVHFYFSFTDVSNPVYWILLILPLIFALLSIIFCFAFYQKKALWITFLILAIISMSLICMPAIADFYEDLYYPRGCSIKTGICVD